MRINLGLVTGLAFAALLVAAALEGLSAAVGTGSAPSAGSTGVVKPAP